ncbi:MAG: hypothetical protein Q7S93_05400 [Phenylobacterium sp.]|uniref:hypothetical protein n=1 Tax=Phenylobacterium sp. TaxID=1871053 RepID=UPI0027192FA8|nr:hypothetical protein [Phenylobacterium sp.]MDO8409476.1 hypothetical protein [Phenylobacterium sp.]
MRQFQDALRRGVGDMKGWIAAREVELQRGLQRSEQALDTYRRGVERAAQSAQSAVVSKTEQLMEAGASRVLPRPAARSIAPPKPSNPSTPTRKPAPAQPAPTAQDWRQEATAQFLAAARGAQDAFTLGLGDQAYAGLGAVGDVVQGDDFGASYQNRMAQERARDAADAQNYAAARTTGQVLGVGGQVLVTGALLGPLGAALVPAARGVRIAQAAPLIFRETAALAGAGGGVGAIGQAAGDISRRKIGTPGDYGGAVVGGALGALAARRGNVAQASAAAGLTESVAQDTLDGGLDTQSAARGRESAAAAAIVGGLVGRSATRHADSMSRKDKELTGEQASRIRNFVRGDRTGPAAKTKEDLPGGGYTFPDLRSYRNGVVSELIESKFGRSARLSKRQLQAVKAFKNYRVDHVLPRDIGAVFGLPASILYPWEQGLEQYPSRQEGRAP